MIIIFTNEKRQKRIITAILAVAVIVLAAFAVAVPTLTEDTSDADTPHFTRTFYAGGVLLGTWFDEHLHAFPYADNQGCEKGVMSDGRIICTVFHTLHVNDGVKAIGNDNFRDMKFRGPFGFFYLTYVFLPDKDLERIGDNAFRGNKIASMTFPVNVNYIGSHAFDDNPLKEITMTSLAPPTLGEKAFGSSVEKIFVPAEVIDSYRSTPGWDQYEDKLVASVTEHSGTEGNIDWKFYNGTLTLSKNPSANNGVMNNGTSYWNMYIRYNVVNVIIEDGVTTIGDECFDGCSNLKSISMPSDLVRIGSYAFNRCSSLESIIIPDGVQVIEHATFSECRSLKSVVLPSALTSINSSAFSSCKALTSVFLPEGLEKIDTGAFAYCIKLQHVAIPNTVKTIGDRAFSRCDSLCSVSIPASVREIGKEAFFICENLRTIYLDMDHKGDFKIGKDAFDIFRWGSGSCDVLSPENKAKDTLETGDHYVRFNYRSATYTYEWKDADGKTVQRDSATDLVTIPEYKGEEPTMDGTKFAGWNRVYDKPGHFLMLPLFSNFDSKSGSEDGIDWYYMEDTLTISSKIEGGAAMKAGRPAWLDEIDGPIKFIIIGDGITTVGSDAFRGLAELRSVIMSDSVVTIDSNAFRDCLKLAQVKFGNGLVTIGSEAFRHDLSLVVLNLPQSLRVIGQSAFEECYALNDLSPNGELESIGSYAFKNCFSLRYLTIGTSGAIGKEAFYGCKIQFAKITSASEIGDKCFKDNADLKTARLGNGVKSIGNEVFMNCPALKTLTMSSTMERIGWSAFENCKSLESVDIPVSVKSLGNNVFKNCGSMTHAYIAATGCAIPDGAFQNCGSLKDLRIYDGVVRIGNYAFQNCRSLSLLSLPDSVVSIGDSSFESCRSLETIVLGNGLRDVEIWAFQDCPKVKTIYCHMDSWNVDASIYAFHFPGDYRNPNMTIVVYSLNNVVKDRINPMDDRANMVYRSIPDFKCTWKNYDGTVLSTAVQTSAGQDPIYSGPTPTHPDDREFLGWTTYLDNNGNLVKTALFQDEVKTALLQGAPYDDEVEKTPFINKVRIFVGDVYGNIRDLIHIIVPPLIPNGGLN